ncbi:MAG: DegT/DnrJ/EryC1/StrS family aminotransferase [Nanoarchaeota archaeon]
MNIEFGDPEIPSRTIDSMVELLKSNRITEGSRVKKFEERWGDLFGYPHSIATPSGTAADTIACMSLYDFGAKRGDEVIVPALAFAAVGEAVLAAGLNPVFIDIKRDTLNIDETKIEQAITSRTRAIMPVHTMGKPAKMDVITDIARAHNLKVIEDACEAHGAKYQGRHIGLWGDAAAFSFYAAHLVFAGEGGMVSTKDDQMAHVLRSVKTHGRKPGTVYFDHERLGVNAKMTDMAATIGLDQLDDFWRVYRTRKDNLVYLLGQTKDLQDRAYFNNEEKGEDICPHAFSVTLKEGDRRGAKDLYVFLEERGIKSKVNFRSMPTQQGAFAFIGHRLGDFPEAEYVGDKGVHFGIHQKLTKDNLDYASEALHDFFKT